VGAGQGDFSGVRYCRKRAVFQHQPKVTSRKPGGQNPPVAGSRSEGNAGPPRVSLLRSGGGPGFARTSGPHQNAAHCPPLATSRHPDSCGWLRTLPHSEASGSDPLSRATLSLMTDCAVQMNGVARFRP